MRLGAYLIDSLIVGIFLLLFRISLHLTMAFLPEFIQNAKIVFSYTIIDVILYCAHAAYFIILTYCTGRTFGKRICHLQVVSQGQKPSLWNIIYRETIGRFLSGVVFGAGYIMVGIDREKRGIHDMLADTRVIYERTFR